MDRTEAIELARRQAEEIRQSLGANDSMSQTILNDQLLANAFLESSDAVTVLDREGRILAWNQGAASVYGYSEAQAHGMSIHALVSADARGEAEEMLEKLCCGQKIDSLETQRVARDGHLIEVLVTAKPILDDEGMLSGIAMTERDITDRKRAREELQRLAAELAAANQELARKNAGLDEFNYVVSHDLQAPLRAVLSFCERARSKLGDDVDPKVLDYLDRSVNAANRMSGLIQALLRYSRLGLSDLDLEVLDLNALLGEVLDNLEGSIRASRARIMVSALPTVRGDRTRLMQLFQNLIGNAIKFKGEDDPVVQVNARAKDGSWCISIGDNGIGIAPEHFDRIFGVFQRLHKRDAYDGTGIGLSICRKIVENHGGRIWVESEPRQGTTFHFTLPCREDAGVE